MPQAIYILLGAVLTVAACIALGSLILSRWKLPLVAEEETLFQFLIGAASLSFAIFLLCATHAVHKGVLVGLEVVLCCVGRNGLRRFRLPKLALHWWVLYGLFGVLYLANAMAPEISPDGMTYHLGFVGRYYREHGFRTVTDNMYGHLSQGLEMLFLPAYALGRHSAAALVHAAFLFASPFLLIAFGRRFAVPQAGLAAGFLFYLSPVVGKDGVSAYNDVAAACVLFAIFYLLRIWDEDRSSNLLWMVGLLAGFGFAIKYTAAFGALYAIGYVLYRSRKIVPVLQVSALAALLAAPWLIKNTIEVGNPVAPFANSIFPNPQFTPAFEKQYAFYMRHFNDAKDADIPLGVTVHGQLLGGIIGPVFLLLPLIFLPGATPLRTQTLIAAMVMTVPYAFNIGTRFLIPPLPFWSLAIALALARFPVVLPALIVLHAVLSWPGVVKQYADANIWRLEKITWKEALRMVPEEKFLQGKARTYMLARMVETHVPAGEQVFSYGACAADAYTSRHLVVGVNSWPGQKLRDLIYAALIEEYRPTWGQLFQLPPTTLQKFRIEQIGSSPIDVWSVSELRVFNGKTELPRASNWRLRASPNPWDVQNAFDNSPMTRWSAGDQIHRGMFLEVDLGSPTSIDAVRAECTRDQYQIRLKLEAPDNSGQWRTISDVPEQVQIPVGGGLRHAAMEEFKNAGIHYLLVDRGDYGEDDFATRQPQWGIQLLDEKDGARLYKLE